MACNQGDCLGCKVNWGDFGQHFHKGCNNDLFFGDGALYMPPKTQCAEVTCGMITGLLQCSCNTKGKCKMKLDGEILRQSFRQKNYSKRKYTTFGKDFDNDKLFKIVSCWRRDAIKHSSIFTIRNCPCLSPSAQAREF